MRIRQTALIAIDANGKQRIVRMNFKQSFGTIIKWIRNATVDNQT